jgi:recombination protein RecA
MAIQLEIVEKSGAWFYYDGERLGQGKENVRKLIESDKELMDKLEALVREKVKNTPIDEDAMLSDDDFEIKDFDEGDI